MLDAIGLNRSVSRSRREPPQCDSHRSVASLKFRESDDLISEFDLEAHCDRDRLGVVKEYFGKRKIDTWRNQAINCVEARTSAQDRRPHSERRSPCNRDTRPHPVPPHCTASLLSRTV